MQLASVRLRVMSLKVWSTDGQVLYSSNKELIGRKYAPKEELREALGGTVATKFAPGHHPENEWERSHGVPMLEVYAPVLDNQGRVVAVTEFYENSDRLSTDLVRAQREGWIVTGLVFGSMVLVLLLIVARGSGTIDVQRRLLTERVSELWQLLRQNQELRGRVEKASCQATEDNERFLRRLGADLHDGPAQLISVALLRLGSLRPSTLVNGGAADVQSDLEIVRGALTDAMNDVRSVCAGLCLPEIESLSLQEALLSSVQDHERRTRTSVLRSISDLPVVVPHFVKICACRFIQEALSNAFRHAAGRGQRVAAWTEGNTIVIEVEDQGPGISPQDGPKSHRRLGLTGLWDRIESLGGVLDVNSRPNEGTRLTARLPIGVGGRA
jgi:signal transduction histidine kinase